MTSKSDYDKFKTKAAENAKHFYEQGLTQDDAVLAKRLDLIPPLSKDKRRAAAFWFAAQRMFLLGETLRSQEASDSEEANTFYRGTLDLLRRCEKSLDVEDDELTLLATSKLIGLKDRCLFVLDVEKKKQEQKESKQAKQDEEIAAAQAFIERQKQISQKKLQLLPDVKLIGILGFDAEDGFVLSAETRETIVNFVHLQTLFQTIQESSDVKMQTCIGQTLLSDLVKIRTDTIEQSFIRDGAFIAVEVLYRRVCEWMTELSLDLGEAADARAIVEQTQRNIQLVKSCYSLGFSAVSRNAQVILTLNTRAFLIGQGLFLEYQLNISDKMLYINSLEQILIDTPILAVMPSGHRLFVSMTSESGIAQVAIQPELIEFLKKKNWQITEYFEAPNDRQSLRITQLDHDIMRLTLAETIKDANHAAQAVFLQLAELGYDWPEAFSKSATIKSLLRRKNLKLIWQDASPFWVLKLRTELSNTFNNEHFAKADQVVKILKRFDF